MKLCAFRWLISRPHILNLKVWMNEWMNEWMTGNIYWRFHMIYSWLLTVFKLETVLRKLDPGMGFQIITSLANSRRTIYHIFCLQVLRRENILNVWLGVSQYKHKITKLQSFLTQWPCKWLMKEKNSLATSSPVHTSCECECEVNLTSHPPFAAIVARE